MLAWGQALSAYCVGLVSQSVGKSTGSGGRVPCRYLLHGPPRETNEIAVFIVPEFHS